MEEFLALDLETSGLSPEKDRIIEIGAIKYRGEQAIDTYSCLICLPEKLPERIVALTGITDEMLAQGLPEREAILGFLEFAKDMPVLLGHNITFDYSFLKVAALRYGQSFERQGMDTLLLSRRLHTELPSRTLEAMCVHYGIEQKQAHRALDDAKTAWELYRCLRKEFPEQELYPAPLIYHEKKREPITPKQKKYLLDLVKYHKIEFMQEIDLLTKSEASRMIDKIILAHGQRPKTASSDK
ncbi:MAG: 3'-5' exonuclease [Lachnospiraceae bacterium]|nr:3'-5' exonuclease [Lachnospiraceae bacterium]